MQKYDSKNKKIKNYGYTFVGTNCEIFFWTNLQLSKKRFQITTHKYCYMHTTNSSN